MLCQVEMEAGEMFLGIINNRLRGKAAVQVNMEVTVVVKQTESLIMMRMYQVRTNVIVKSDKSCIRDSRRGNTELVSKQT
ncbi:hypothetical protein BgiBS90_017923 [Biomphalaria glabrata]|nr:hypothetical protein BgiBS90_017923 [Biomphalaria glabrata]